MLITCTKNDKIWARGKNMHKLLFDYDNNDVDLKELNSINNKIGELKFLFKDILERHKQY